MNIVSEKTKIDQLRMSLKIIKESLKRFDINPEINKEEIIIISSQLRALVCLGGRNFHPLLIELANQKNIELICYGPQNINTLPTFVKEAVFFHRTNIISITPKERFIKYKFVEWLNSEIIILENIIFTPNEILRLKADSEASHYDPILGEKLELLKSLERHTNTGKISEPDFYVIETAKAVTHLISFLI